MNPRGAVFQPDLIELMRSVLDDVTAMLPEAKRTSSMKKQFPCTWGSTDMPRVTESGPPSGVRAQHLDAARLRDHDHPRSRAAAR